MALATISQSSPNDTVSIHVVLQKRRGRWFLYKIDGPRDISGEALLVKILELYAIEVRTICFVGRRSLSFRRPVVNIGTLSSVCTLFPMMLIEQDANDLVDYRYEQSFVSL
jgi:hypothetical protein